MAAWRCGLLYPLRFIHQRGGARRRALRAQQARHFARCGILLQKYSPGVNVPNDERLCNEATFEVHISNFLAWDIGLLHGLLLSFPRKRCRSAR